jgi:pyruvate dehydrogenase E1 component beta subunit
MVWHAMVAAQALAPEGISVEVVDVRTIAPLDGATIGASARKTGRVVAVAEAAEQYGPANEWAMVAMEQAWDRLRAPIVRVAGRNSPIPFANSLENGVWPGTQDVIDAIRRVVAPAPGA